LSLTYSVIVILNSDKLYIHVCVCVCVCVCDKADELSPADDAPGKTDERDLWIAYCAFHLADYQRALQVRVT